MADPERENPFASPEMVRDEPRPGARSWEGYWAAVIAAVVVGVVLLVFSPGLGVLFALVAVPGLIAAWVRLERQYLTTGQQVAGGRQFLAVAGIVLLFVPLLVVAFITFGITCWATAVVVKSTMLRPEPEYVFWVLNWALPAGGMAGLAVYALLFFLVLGKKPPREMVEDVEAEKHEEPHA